MFIVVVVVVVVVFLMIRATPCRFVRLPIRSNVRLRAASLGRDGQAGQKADFEALVSELESAELVDAHVTERRSLTVDTEAEAAKRRESIRTREVLGVVLGIDQDSDSEDDSEDGDDGDDKGEDDEDDNDEDDSDDENSPEDVGRGPDGDGKRGKIKSGEHIYINVAAEKSLLRRIRELTTEVAGLRAECADLRENRSNEHADSQSARLAKLVQTLDKLRGREVCVCLPQRRL